MPARGTAPRGLLSVLLLAASLSVGHAVYWLEAIAHNGLAAYNAHPAKYPVFRNVKEYGATGDGVTDDTAAINAAISVGGRCGLGCDSSTTTPRLVYFPAGTYVVSKPIVAYYFSQLVGDPTAMPVLQATADFAGIAVIDADPYAGEPNWYVRTNNFYRAVRNLVIDLRATGNGTGVHWQIAQATSLQNLVFEMSGTRAQGIFMENGSGGFMTDLTFRGGRLGAFLGNQQLTSRNLTFHGCDTAIEIVWNWAWTLKSVHIHHCQRGLDLRQPGVGSVVLLDSTIAHTPVGVVVAASVDAKPRAAHTLLIDHLVTHNVPQIVATPTGHTLRAGSTGPVTLAGWGKGHTIHSNPSAAVVTEARMQGDLTPFHRPSVLLKDGVFFERSRPQYEALDISEVISARAAGAKGDGVTDDTAVLQQLLDTCAASGQLLFLDHGVYRITATLTIRPGTRVMGEVWATLMAAGEFFRDQNQPQVMLRVGLPGDTGVVELVDLALMTQGPAPGAILLEWNNADPAGQQGVSGMWDVHARVGGSAGSNLQSDRCAKRPSEPLATSLHPDCMAAFMLMHVGKTGSVYMENNWLWTADHELDLAGHEQVAVFAGRGFWSESLAGPLWMYGTAVEHNVLYQYMFTNTKNVVMGHLQTETAYHQSHPGVDQPFPTTEAYLDPMYDCAATDPACAKAWGLRMVNASDILVAGAGLYSFFENWSQDCLDQFPQTCQTRLTSIEGVSRNVVLYNMNTVGTRQMVTLGGVDAGRQSVDTNNSFAHTAVWISATSSSTGPEMEMLQ